MRDFDATHHQEAVVAVTPEERLATTRNGDAISYDALIIATGADPEEAVPGALTYRGEADRDALRTMIAEFEHEGVGRTIAYTVPSGTTWTLPLYELALITAARFRATGNATRVKLVTPETAPLEIFGRRASEALAELLASRGVEVFTSTHPVKFPTAR